MNRTRYPGGELALFAQATNWKSYFAALLLPFLGRRVLEVGAGIGGTTISLTSGRHERWVCLEPDAQQVRQIATLKASGALPDFCEERQGTIDTLESEPVFDTILYIDVLEHIADDRDETRQAARRLAAGGYLVILSPAHPWLFAPFDHAVGHLRRYTRGSLAAVVPGELKCVRLRYLDAIGLLASASNRFLLRQRMPTRRQLWVWDKLMVPISRMIDPLTFYRAGKSILGIWRKSTARR